MRGRGCTTRTEAAAAASGSEQGASQPKRLGRRARQGESPVGDGGLPSWCGTVSTTGHEEPRGKLGRPRSKAQYALRPIAHEYREGTVKSTPARGVKQLLKPFAYRRSEPGALRLRPEWRQVMACLLKYEPASCSVSCPTRRGGAQGERKRVRTGRSARAGLGRGPNWAPGRTGSRAPWHGADPKPGELPMASVKVR